MVLCQGERPFSIPRNVPLHIREYVPYLALLQMRTGQRRTIMYCCGIYNVHNRRTDGTTPSSTSRVGEFRRRDLSPLWKPSSAQIKISLQPRRPSLPVMRIYDERPRTNEKVQYLLERFQNARRWCHVRYSSRITLTMRPRCGD
jgi:hypothetical protein